MAVYILVLIGEALLRHEEFQLFDDLIGDFHRENGFKLLEQRVSRDIGSFKSLNAELRQQGIVEEGDVNRLVNDGLPILLKDRSVSLKVVTVVLGDSFGGH
jgi:hypothetical protein